MAIDARAWSIKGLGSVSIGEGTLARCAAMGASAVYILTLHVVYFYNPRGPFAQTLAPISPWLMSLGLLCAWLPSAWLPASFERPSGLACWVLYVTPFVPACITPTYGTVTLAPEFIASIVLTLTFCFIALVTMLQQRLPRLSYPVLPLWGLWATLLVISIVGYAAIWRTFGFHFQLVSFRDVYELREGYAAMVAQAGAVGKFANKVANWLGWAVNVFIIATALRLRRPLLMALGLAGQVLLYGMMGQKSALSVGLIVIFLYLLVRHGSRWMGAVVPLCAVALAVLGALIDLAFRDRFLGIPWATALLVRRPFFVPGMLSSYYFEYFTLHEKAGIAVPMLGYSLTDAYNAGVPRLIGAEYFKVPEMWANANIWASAYVEAGFAGLIYVTLLAFIVCWTVDVAANGRDALLAGLMLAHLATQWANSEIWTTLVGRCLPILPLLLWYLGSIKLRDGCSPANGGAAHHG